MTPRSDVLEPGYYYELHWRYQRIFTVKQNSVPRLTLDYMYLPSAYIPTIIVGNTPLDYWLVDLDFEQHHWQALKQTFNMSQDEIDDILNALISYAQSSQPNLPGLGTQATNNIPLPPSFTYSPGVSGVVWVSEEALKSTYPDLVCECGSDKTYGIDVAGHSSWCPKYKKV